MSLATTIVVGLDVLDPWALPACKGWSKTMVSSALSPSPVVSGSAIHVCVGKMKST